MRQDPQALRTFSTLPTAEKRLVVELGETAQMLARRYPDEAETMVRRLGPEGLTAVRVYGDDVAEVLAKEGPESIGVLRKTGLAGWSFFTKKVLPHKKKLAAAGILAAFLADPEKFVDYAGQATEYAVREFGKAGIQLASAVTGGAVPRDRAGRRRHARRLRTEFPPAPLPRHGDGRAGRGTVLPRDHRVADPMDVPAAGVAVPYGIGVASGRSGRLIRGRVAGQPPAGEIVNDDEDQRRKMKGPGAHRASRPANPFGVEKTKRVPVPARGLTPTAGPPPP